MKNLSFSIAALTLIAGTASADTIFGLTTGNSLVSFDSGSPLTTTAPIAIAGLQAGENLLGIDFRPLNGQLYGLGSTGRLYTLNTSSGLATQVGSGTFALALSGTSFGFDFNPTVDRIRLTSNTGQNLRLNPITGGVVDADTVAPGVQPDGTISYGAGDVSAGLTPNIVGSAYTNSFNGSTSTVLYNIDAFTGNLTSQGTLPGVTPVVSPNSGTQFTIGSLLLDTGSMVGFDISPSNNTAFLAAVIDGFPNSALYRVNLSTGAVTFISSISADALVDIAIAVPSPSAAGLFGLAVLGAARRRR